MKGKPEKGIGTPRKLQVPFKSGEPDKLFGRYKSVPSFLHKVMGLLITEPAFGGSFTSTISVGLVTDAGQPVMSKILRIE